MPAVSNPVDPTDKTTRDKNANKVMPSTADEKRVKIHDTVKDPKAKMSKKQQAPGHICRRGRTVSSSKSEDHLMTTDHGMKVYTKGRPPWYDLDGKRLTKPYLIGICGGSASGKTTVAKSIIERLGMQWVTVLSMDSFYRVLSKDQHELAAKNEYNFDTPDAFDFDLLLETLRRLSEGKSVDVPVYDFTTHRRDVNTNVMYGADVLIFEGILAFYMQEIVDLMDIKIFVDTDADTRLARRLSRDTGERGRDFSGVLDQYIRHVKPAFEQYIGPGAKVADVIIPRGGENLVAIDLIVRQVKTQLAARGYEARSPKESWDCSIFGNRPMPESLHIVKETPQVKGLQTFIRCKDTSRDEFVFYSERLMRILIEYAVNYVSYEDVEIKMPNGKSYFGRRKNCDICGVAVMRAGETLEKSLRDVVKDCKVGKILIQTNTLSMMPELYFLRLPRHISKYRVLLMDATVATGSCATMAIRILLDHDVLEENIILCALLMAQPGIQRIAYSFPRVKLITSCVDPAINELYHIIPGMGNFGDRYFGTEYPNHHSEPEFVISSDEDASVSK